MELARIIYGPTLNNAHLTNKITAQIKKYKGMFREQKELLVVTDKLERPRRSAAEYIVLNADSPQLNDLNQFIYQAKNVIYYSKFKNNIIIQSQFRQGQPVVYKNKSNLVLFDGQDALPLAAVNELGGKDITEALFTIAAGFIAELPFYIIRRMVKDIRS